MKRLALALFYFVLLAGFIVASPVDDFCEQFGKGAEVRVYRAYPQPGFDKDKNWLKRAKKEECFELLGDIFYPEAKKLSEKDTNAWLALATNPKSYYTTTPDAKKPDPQFYSDLAFWCITPDHKSEVYCLVSFNTSQMKIAFTGDGLTYSMTLELEKLCREILQRTFEEEIKAEQAPTSPKG